jgi:hypothetical protein
MAPWRSLEDLRQIYPFRRSRRPVHRLQHRRRRPAQIARVEHHRQEIHLRDVRTRAQYDKEDWKRVALMSTGTADSLSSSPIEANADLQRTEEGLGAADYRQALASAARELRRRSTSVSIHADRLR